MASTGSIGPNGSSNFMPGLASGLDTEDMVDKLLSGTQAKIDKQNAKKQQIEWKQEIYRDVITKINSFSDKYFSFFGTNNTNLLSSSFCDDRYQFLRCGKSGFCKVNRVSQCGD